MRTNFDPIFCCREDRRKKYLSIFKLNSQLVASHTFHFNGKFGKKEMTSVDLIDDRGPEGPNVMLQSHNIELCLVTDRGSSFSFVTYLLFKLHQVTGCAIILFRFLYVNTQYGYCESLQRYMKNFVNQAS